MRHTWQTFLFTFAKIARHFHFGSEHDSGIIIKTEKAHSHRFPVLFVYLFQALTLYVFVFVCARSSFSRLRIHFVVRAANNYYFPSFVLFAVGCFLSISHSPACYPLDLFEIYFHCCHIDSVIEHNNTVGCTDNAH